MTKLLVSVRNAWEAGEALAGGADVIDVKEPQFGSLGAASSATRAAVRLAVLPAPSFPPELSLSVRNTVPLSAALGELLEHRGAPDPWQLDGYSYAKVGFAGCAAIHDWEQLWRTWLASLPVSIAPVGVVYADYRTVEAPSPWQVLHAAFATRVRTLLIDTCDKTSGDLLDRIAACELADVISGARSKGFSIALAGSITLDSLSEVLRFEPNWIAVRGAICRSGRESILDRELVERFAARLSTPRDANAVTRDGEMIDSIPYRA